MYKIILKDADTALETHNEDDPFEAAKIWASLRARPLDGQTVVLQAA